LTPENISKPDPAIRAGLSGRAPAVHRARLADALRRRVGIAHPQSTKRRTIKSAVVPSHSDVTPSMTFLFVEDRVEVLFQTILNSSLARDRVVID